MKSAKANTARKEKRTARNAVDPRLAAFARLLARHAARRDYEKELNRSPTDVNVPDSFSGE